MKFVFADEKWFIYLYRSPNRDLYVTQWTKFSYLRKISIPIASLTCLIMLSSLSFSEVLLTEKLQKHGEVLQNDFLGAFLQQKLVIWQEETVSLHIIQQEDL